MPTVTKAIPLLVKSADYGAFVRSNKNLRASVERPELLRKIKADGGVQIPCVVYPGLDENGKIVIFEGNSRHWCLEQLAKDKDYKGSLDFPYFEIPADKVGDPIKELMFAINLGTTNEQLSPLEQAKGYHEAVNLGIEKYWNKALNFDKLSTVEQQELIKEFSELILDANDLDPDNPKHKKDYEKLRKSCLLAAKRDIKENSAETAAYIEKILRVYELSFKNPMFAEMLNNGLLSVYAADIVLRVSKAVDKPVDLVTEASQKVQLSQGKPSITEVHIRQAERFLKHEQLTSLVLKNAVPVDLTDEVLKVARIIGEPLDEVIRRCNLDLGGVSIEALNIVAQAAKLYRLKDADELEDVVSAPTEPRITPNAEEIIIRDKIEAQKELRRDVEQPDNRENTGSTVVHQTELPLDEVADVVAEIEAANVEVEKDDRNLKEKVIESIAVLSTKVSTNLGNLEDKELEGLFIKMKQLINWLDDVSF